MKTKSFSPTNFWPYSLEGTTARFLLSLPEISHLLLRLCWKGVMSAMEPSVATALLRAKSCHLETLFDASFWSMPFKTERAKISEPEWCCLVGLRGPGIASAASPPPEPTALTCTAEGANLRDRRLCFARASGARCVSLATWWPSVVGVVSFAEEEVAVSGG